MAFLDVAITQELESLFDLDGVYVQLRTAGDLTGVDVGNEPPVTDPNVEPHRSLVIVGTTAVALEDEDNAVGEPTWGTGARYVATVEVDIRSPNRRERNRIIDIVTGASYTRFAGYVAQQVDPTALSATEETGEPLRFEATVNLQVLTTTNPLLEVP